MSDTFHQRLSEQLKSLERKQLRRRRNLASGLDFASNDYLGMARDDKVIAAAIAALKYQGMGSGGSALLSGYTDFHQQAEHAAADWQDEEAAILFSSGYQCNLAIFSACFERGTHFFSDRLNHASLIDGLRLSRHTVSIFEHNNIEHLRALLQKSHGQQSWIIVESRYSMDGDLAPLEAISQLAKEFSCGIIVDDAHSVGLDGPRARGLGSTLADNLPTIRVLPAGKALGAQGAFAVGNTALIETLVNRGRSYIYSTAPSPAIAAGLGTAIARLPHYQKSREHLRALERHLRQELNARRWKVSGDGPIVAIWLGSNTAAVQTAQKLSEQGIWVPAIRPPTVPPDTARLRVVLNARHTIDDLNRLLDALGDAPASTPSSQLQPSDEPTVCGHYVLGTDTDVGKTVVSALLTRALARRGDNPCYLKPVQTGADSDTQTVATLLQTEDLCQPPPFHLALPASIDQAAEAEDTRLSVDQIYHRVVSGLSSERRWVVESAGGILVPINEREDQLELVCRLRLPAVLVARSGLGTLNHTLLTCEVLKNNKVPIVGLFLVGPEHAANIATLKNRLSMPIFSLPHFDSLNLKAIDHWLDHNPIHEIFDE